jgi:hypothetical protein
MVPDPPASDGRYSRHWLDGARGGVDLIQEVDGEHRVVELRPGEAVVNPRNVWHTATVHEPGDALFVTPGRGTENRPR